MKNLADISADQLRRAADIREQVDNLARELHQIFGLAPLKDPATPSTALHAAKVKHQPAARKKTAMSAAARARISTGMKRSWQQRKWGKVDR